MYVNGTLVGTRAVDGDIVNTDEPLRIGGNAVWGEYFAGLIDEVRVYNRPLTAQEIATDGLTPIGSGGGAAAAAAAAGSGTITVPGGTFSEVRVGGRRRTWYEAARQVL